MELENLFCLYFQLFKKKNSHLGYWEVDYIQGPTKNMFILYI